MAGRKHSLYYALAGTFLSIGAPVGLLLLRAVSEPLPSLSAVRADLLSNEGTYLYVLAGTMVVFTMFGYVLGREVDALQQLSSDLERRVIARTAELQAANDLKDALILREQSQAAELAAAREHEVEIGYRIQQTLLLDQPPADFPGLRLAAFTVPSQRIDGDFYIFIRHLDRALDVIVGDVMGKGIPAALLGAAAKSHFLKAHSDLMALSNDGRLPEPSEIVTRAHAGIVRHLIELESFVTLCYARFDVHTHRLVLVDCGHTGVVQWHARSGRYEARHGDNLPMGVREGEIFRQIVVPFEPGDLFLFYSDGITEARDPARGLFGVERLEQCVRTNSHLDPTALLEAVRRAVFEFSRSDRLTDDLTGVAIRVGDIPIVRPATQDSRTTQQITGGSARGV